MSLATSMTDYDYIAAMSSQMNVEEAYALGDVAEKMMNEEEKPDEKDDGTSNMEIEFVDETWDNSMHAWSSKTIDRSEVLPKGREKKKGMLTVRRQFGIPGMLETREEQCKTFADIKSEGLRDVLREVLEGVKSVSLRGKKPSMRLEVLYSYLPDLQRYLDAATEGEAESIMQLKELIKFLEDWYSSTSENLVPLLAHGEITYDLLWALFKPSSKVYTIDQDSEQPKCLTFDHGENQERQGQKFFELSCRYLAYDGQFFGEAQNWLMIPEFRGARKISSLEVYPLQYSANAIKIKEDLVTRGRKFLTLMGKIHCEYNGLAYYKVKGKAVKINIKGRAMIDAASFKEFNPNYANPNIDPDDPITIGRQYDIVRGMVVLSNGPKVKKALNERDLAEEELILCSPAVAGFSLSKRQWMEFTVAGVYDVTWNDLPFDALVLPSKKKGLLQALVQQATSDTANARFDDIVEDKGNGLVILLHGAPGVGKTLTAEAISEFQKRPLYRVTAGDLDLDSKKLEEELSEILDLATRWKAIILLDEADVFVEERTLHNLLHNTLVSVFLRLLEYFQGVMILTTNRVKVFDDAIKSRIHLGIKYDDLNKEARLKIWKTFIEKTDALAHAEKKNTITPKQLEELGHRKCNGRQIKNTVRIAYALAASTNTPLGYEHLITALDANEDFDNEHRGAGKGPNENSYL